MYCCETEEGYEKVEKKTMEQRSLNMYRKKKSSRRRTRITRKEEGE